MIALIGRISPYLTINCSLSAAQFVVKVSVAMLVASINAKTMNTAPMTMKNPVPRNKNGKLQMLVVPCDHTTGYGSQACLGSNMT